MKGRMSGEVDLAGDLQDCESVQTLKTVKKYILLTVALRRKLGLKILTIFTVVCFSSSNAHWHTRNFKLFILARVCRFC